MRDWIAELVSRGVYSGISVCFALPELYMIFCRFGKGEVRGGTLVLGRFFNYLVEVPKGLRGFIHPVGTFDLLWCTLDEI